MTNFHLLCQSAECSKRTRKNGTEQKEKYDKIMEVNSLETFKEAITHNHTMGLYEKEYRKGDNWRGAEVLYADVDSGTTIEDFKNDFKDYEFYIATSKSHLKDKDGTGAHPRFHIYFPIAGTTNKESFKKALIKLCNSKPYFDKQVKDIGRYFNTSPENCEIYYNNGKSILDYIFSIPDIDIVEKEVKEIIDFHYDFTIDEVYQYFNKLGLIRTVEGYYNVNTKQWIDERQLLHLTKELRIKDCEQVENENIKKFRKNHTISIGEYWINNQKDNSENPLYNNIGFRPDLPYGKNEIAENGLRIWNTFKGFKRIDSFEGDINPILNHIKEVICDNNEEVFVYVIKWMAHLFQKPFEKPRVAIGVRGERQIGKGVIFDDLLKNLLNEMEYIITDFSCIDRTVNNNIEIRDKLLIYFMTIKLFPG
jgi:hypothetical protein